jgi:diguanylate cyclase
MFELITTLLVGCAAGCVLGWVIGHNFAANAQVSQDAALQPEVAPSSESEGRDQLRLDEIARKIRSLTFSVAEDVDAHRNKMADITSDLQDSGEHYKTEQIIATVAELVAANLEMQSKLDESQARIREQAKQLQTTQQLANTDSLTGLSNRRGLDHLLEEIDGSSDELNESACFGLIDIDHFKSINDTFGHDMGDKVLVRVAEVLEFHLESVGVSARWGGEEFAVVCRNADLENVAVAVDRARRALGKKRLIPDSDRRVTFSAGIALRSQAEPSDDWLRRADRALYAAKEGGRDGVFVAVGSKVSRFGEPSTLEGRGIDKSTAEKAISSAADPQEGLNSHAARQCLVSQLRTMATNIDLDHVNLAAVAIRFPDLSLTVAQREDILASSRGLLRAVDKVGFDDERTLLSLMVTTNTRKTVDRANELLEEVNRALQSVCGDDIDIPSATLGISLLDRQSTPEEVIRRAAEAAVNGVNEVVC